MRTIRHREHMTIAGLLDQTGKCLAKASALTADSGAGNHKKESDGEEQQEIDKSNRAGATAYEFIQASYGRINKVGEKDGEEKQNQGPACGIEKAQTQGEE